MSRIKVLKEGTPQNELPQLADLERSIQKYQDEYYKKAKDANAWIISRAKKNWARVEAYDLLEKINVCHLKKQYVGKKVNQVNDKTIYKDNIKTYTEGTDEFYNKFIYYSNKINTIPYVYDSEEKFYYRDKYIQYSATETGNLTQGLDLKKYVKQRGPVVVAQEYYGSGVLCTMPCIVEDKDKKIYKYITQPEFDAFDDRITKIYHDKNSDKIIIQEFYRANVDVSIGFKESIDAILEGNGKGLSTHAGAFDFIVSTYQGKNALRLFHYEKTWELNETYKNNTFKKRVLEYIYNHYVNNSVPPIAEDFPKVEKQPRKGDYNFTQEFGELVTTKNIDEGKKMCILVHIAGADRRTGSLGCLTITYNDYPTFINTFEMYKFGMLFLFRDPLIIS